MTPLLERYTDKIRTPEQLRELIGERPRARKVVMCHGSFDIVHPGHIRHLLYARSKGDLLVASLTADRFIDKGEGRPYVIEELRAINLAALEFVDYVIVDQQPTPLENIAFIQPDYFVKGFEYASAGVHPKTKEEMAVVQGYGGQFVFSPGDVVYSSTALLEYERPKLALDKLLVLMKGEGISFDDLEAALRGLDKIRLHVVGDTIVDKYTYCTLLGAAPKSPTFSVRRDRTERFVGGAGIVAKHMHSLGAQVTFSTLLGDDALSEFVLQDLAEAGISTTPIIEAGRPTTEKERFWAAGQKLLQVDDVDNHPINEQLRERFAEQIARTSTDGVVFSDFRHGMFHSQSIPPLTEAIPPGVLRVADSQVSNRWGNILDFRGFDLITPNEREARFALGDQDSGVRKITEELFARAECKGLIMTLGARGNLTYRQRGSNPRDWFYVESLTDDVSDPTGSGDALLATSTLVLKNTGSIVMASILGNIAGGMACAQQGNVPLQLDAIRSQLASLREDAV